MKRAFCILLVCAAALGLWAPTLAEGGFADVDEAAPYAQAVQWCFENGMMNGTSAGRFEPDASLTRAMLATVLYRAENTPAVSGASGFSDVPAGAWYADAVAWCAQEGLVQGYGGGRFGPEDPLTCEQLAIILRRYGGETAAAAVDTADPGRSATRAEVAVAICALLAQPSPETGSRVLVAVFSATGATKAAAEKVQAAAGGDWFEIVPASPYTSADLKYSDSGCRANREQQDDTARPAIAAGCEVENMDQYDVIFLGYPIWWGTPPKIVRTFLESYDFSGKTIVPFCTSGGSALSTSGLAQSAPGAAWEEGRRLNGASQESVNRWVDGLGLTAETASAANLVVRCGDATVTFALNGSPAAKSLAAQLPLTLEVQPFGSNEQTFYPPQALDTAGTPAITSAPAGTLAYYAPWKDVVLFYEDFSGGSGGLYELGRAIDGLDAIRGLSGTITVTAE